MLHIKKTTLNDLKHLREEAENLKRQEYLKKFGSIRHHISPDDFTERELEDFY